MSYRAPRDKRGTPEGIREEAIRNGQSASDYDFKQTLKQFRQKHTTRFSEAFQEANLRETLAGKIVLSIGCDMRSDEALELPPGTKEMLDELHLRKIDLADEVLILNVAGYIGESTSRELLYAQRLGKRIRFLE